MAYYLIAGAAGFVGSRFAERLLQRGHRVRGIVRNPDTDEVERLATQGMSVWTGDISRLETLSGVADGVEHVFNVTSAPVLDNRILYKTYVEGNQNLMTACSRSRSVRSFIFTSNYAPYGNTGDQVVTEDHPVAPTYPLGEILVEAELAIMRMVRQYRFPAIIMRVASIYGPGRDFIDAVLNSTVTIYGDGRNYIPRIHIDDLLNILELVVDYGQVGAIYNVADDLPTRQIDLYRAVRERLGMVPPRTYSPEIALRSGINANIVGRSVASVNMSSIRLKHDLRYTLQYPSYHTWLDQRLGVEQELELVA